MLGTKVIEERKSKFNGNLRVVSTWGMGTYITSQGLTQSGGIVEVIWRSTLRNLKSQISNLKSCLILGLGGGTVAKLIRKNWPSASIVGVDIDPIMIELGKKYLRLEEAGVDIKIQDAEKYLSAINNKQSTMKFDLIIVDLYNGDKYPKKFESQSFFKKIREIGFVRGPLLKQKIVIFNRLYYKDKKAEAEKFGKKLEKVFPKVEKFRPEANLMFICSN